LNVPSVRLAIVTSIFYTPMSDGAYVEALV